MEKHAHEKQLPGETAKGIKKLSVLLVILILLVSALMGIYFLWEAPPEIAEPVETPAPTPAPTPEPTLSPEEIELAEEAEIKDAAPVSDEDTGRREGIYTILLAGTDDAASLTDTIVVAYMDTVNHEMNFVNIPRDTAVVAGGKINSVYYGANRDTGSDDPGIEALIEQVRNIIGYTVDAYAVINIKTFIDVIDAMGGIWFDVPTDIAYIDQANDYSVFQRQGYYHIDGETAMGIVRYREGYTTGDLGRIETQHAFLKAAADQCLSLGKIPHMKKVLDILSTEVQTDLSAANIAYFMRRALQCRSENIRFMTVPVHSVLCNDISYAVIDEWNWCEMLNEYFNPFEDVTYFPQSLNIIIEAYGKVVYSQYPMIPFG